MPALSVAVTVSVLLPALSGTVADQCAKLSPVMAATPLMTTEFRPETVSEAVPCTMMLLCVVEPDEGLEIAMPGVVASCVEETLAARAKWIDAGLVRAGLRVFEELGVTINIITGH